MKPFFITVTALFALSVHHLNAAETSTPRKPNIIFILADDLGNGNVSAYGSDNFKTPNIDALAKSGMRFERCFSAPVCGPSRALLMTGRYGFRTGMTGNDKESAKIMAEATEIMIPKVLKPAGYVTGQVGKWSQVPLEPSDWGFDEYLRFQASGDYWNTQDRAKNYTLNGKSVPLADGEYLPEKMHDFAVDFIKRHQNEPFFLYYPMSHVHTDILPTPDSAPDSKDLFMDNIKYMDKLVGKLMAELDRLKLRENTIVFFVGDNGVHPGEGDRSTIRGRRISGAKGMMLEGGSLVPCIASWPGTIPAEKVSQNLTDFSDFFPTFTEIVGGKLPEGVTLDGTSFLPVLKGEPGHPRDSIFVELGRLWYARESAWKLNQSNELFDMKDAPFVETLVPADTTNPDAIAARKRLQAVLDKLNVTAGRISHGDGTGKHADKAKSSGKKAGGKKEESAAPAEEPGADSEESPEPKKPASDDRGARFDKLDKEKSGKLTREQYLKKQSDIEVGAKRFDKMDADKNGILTRDEFLKAQAK
ncbi:MAG: sulfatase-like hydrolase/transferase [Akkermansiaceae bacterium]|nr:sulfatase-like hydrolase/transferase [Akkermansiaceae bacterium]